MPRRVVVSAARAAGIIVALVALTACTVGPSNRPGLVVAGQQPLSAAAAPNAPKPLPGLETPKNSTVDWSDCTDDTRQRLGALTVPSALTFQCARVIGALDSPSAPGQGVVRTQLLRVGTGATPLLVVNDLSGLPGTLYAARLAATLPAAFLKTFSLVGLDRRGTGGSDGVHCVPQADRDRLIGYDPASQDLTGLLDASRDASQQCILDLDTRTAALDTWRTAEDLETVRTQLGVAHLDAIGHGEGSRVLTVYADRYAGHVGRFVLDGSPDPTLNSTDTAKAQATAAEAAFGAFATDCVSRAGCPLGADPRGALTQLLANLASTPLTLPDGGEVTSGTALRGTLTGLSDRSTWPALADALGKARSGDGSGLATLIGPALSGTQSDPARIDAQLVSGCNDQSDRLSPGQVASAMKSWSASMPLFGGLFAQGLLWCGPWPVPNQPLPKPTAPGTPPILVMSTATDPVTPEQGTQRTAQQLSDGVLVSWLGAGHGALGQSSCATSAAQRFLVAGQVPQNLTTCPV